MTNFIRNAMTLCKKKSIFTEEIYSSNQLMYVNRLNGSLLYYVSLHAYGQSWLTPFGYKTERY